MSEGNGQWEIQVDGSNVVLSLAHLAEDSVEAFRAEMSKDKAVLLAAGLLDAVIELEGL